MKFFIRLFAEILATAFVVFTTTKLFSSGHTRAGAIFAAISVVALALRATIQREVIKDDARERRRLEKAFVTAVSEAGWPRLVKVDRGRKIVSYYIRVPYQGPNDDFYFEFPLEEERLAEQVQLVDILPKEDVDEFYGVEEDKEVNTDTATEE